MEVMREKQRENKKKNALFNFTSHGGTAAATDMVATISEDGALLTASAEVETTTANKKKKKTRTEKQQRAGGAFSFTSPSSSEDEDDDNGDDNQNDFKPAEVRRGGGGREPTLAVGGNNYRSGQQSLDGTPVRPTTTVKTKATTTSTTTKQPKAVTPMNVKKEIKKKRKEFVKPGERFKNALGLGPDPPNSNWIKLERRMFKKGKEVVMTVVTLHGIVGCGGEDFVFVFVF